MKNAEFAILSLVVEDARHGYNIEQELKTRGMRAWTEVGFSSIYYLLNKLEQQGLVESQLKQTTGKGPARKVYTATEAGIEACQQATIDALALPYRTYPPVLLGLANLDCVPNAAAISALRQQEQALTQRLTDIQTAQVAQSANTAAKPIFDYSLAMLTARINWLKAYCAELESKEQKEA